MVVSLIRVQLEGAGGAEGALRIAGTRKQAPGGVEQLRALHARMEAEALDAGNGFLDLVEIEKHAGKLKQFGR